MIPRSAGAGQYPSASKNIPLYVTGRDKPVAFFSPALRLLHKVVDGKRHFLKTPPSISFDDGILSQASALGAVNIAVTDGSCGDRYTVSFDVFRANCETVNRGHGRQLALHFTFWSKNGAPSGMEQRKAAEEARAETASMKQLGLFGEVAR